METGSIPANKASPLALSPPARSTAGSSHSLGKTEIKHSSRILQLRPSLKASLSLGWPPAEVRHPAPRVAGGSGGSPCRMLPSHRSPLGAPWLWAGFPQPSLLQKHQRLPPHPPKHLSLLSPGDLTAELGGALAAAPRHSPTAAVRCATLPERDLGPCCSPPGV